MLADNRHPCFRPCYSLFKPERNWEKTKGRGKSGTQNCERTLVLPPCTFVLSPPPFLTSFRCLFVPSFAESTKERKNEKMMFILTSHFLTFAVRFLNRCSDQDKPDGKRTKGRESPSCAFKSMCAVDGYNNLGLKFQNSPREQPWPVWMLFLLWQIYIGGVLFMPASMIQGEADRYLTQLFLTSV